MKVENLEAGKRKLKQSMTRQLNELAGRIAGGEITSREEMEEIKAISSVWRDLGKSHGYLGRVTGVVSAREKP